MLNREDPDWYWIVRSDGQEGFIPSGFVYPAVVQGSSLYYFNSIIIRKWMTSLMSALNCINFLILISAAQQEANQTIHASQINTKTNNSKPQQDNDNRYHGTELVMLYDYKVSKNN